MIPRNCLAELSSPRRGITSAPSMTLCLPRPTAGTRYGQVERSAGPDIPEPCFRGVCMITGGKGVPNPSNYPGSITSEYVGGKNGSVFGGQVLDPTQPPGCRFLRSCSLLLCQVSLWRAVSRGDDPKPPRGRRCAYLHDALGNAPRNREERQSRRQFQLPPSSRCVSSA